MVVGLELWSVKRDAEQARAFLDQVISDAGALRTPAGRASALATVDDSTELLVRAERRATGSVLLSTVGRVPGISSQRRALLLLLRDARTGAVALRDVLAGVDEVASQTRVEQGRVPYQSLEQLAKILRTASETVSSMDRSGPLPFGPLGDARRHLNQLASRSLARIDLAVEGVEAAHGFTGGAGDRRYFVAVLNNAEMRDQGMVLAYAVAEFKEGTLGFQRHGSVEELTLDRPTSTPIPPGTLEVFGALAPTQTWQSVNASADFALSGRVMADMFRQATGQSVDGVVAIDVPGLAAILRTVGPVGVPGEAEPITADNLGRRLLHELYEGIPVGGDRTRLREREANITNAVIERLTSADYGVLTLAEELGTAAAGGHLRLWSRVATEERAFEHLGIGGGPATKAAARTFHLAVQNRSATKVDYYVKPRVHQAVHINTSGTATVTTTVEIENQAPVGAPPSYQLGPDATIRNAGDYLAWVLLWSPAGSTVAGGVVESGLVLRHHVLPVDAGARVTFTWPVTVIPDAVRNGRFDLRLVPQPRLEPVPLQVDLTADGWEITGPQSWQGPWDRVVQLSWQVES